MRRRAVREIGTLAGVLAILGGMVLVNYLTRQQNLKERMITWRQQIEAKRVSKGLGLLPWALLGKTTGTVRKGPTFDPELLKWDNKQVDLIGFMVPVEKFRAITEFILLPMPIECYFCQRPPMRDVALIRMEEGKTTDLYKEPILINGVLRLKKGPTKFFYEIEDTTFGPGEEGGKLTKAAPTQEAIAHAQAQQEAQQPLLEAEKPPTADEASTAQKPPQTADAGQQRLAEEKRYLEENAKKDGVVTLPSGLQYKDLREGAGRIPTLTDKVKTHYRGSLIDGTVFDSSYDRNEPAVFRVDQVIPGWTEALQLMREGAKWQLVIPSELAYGERGAGKTIPPNATLIFEIELIEVVE